MRWASGPDEFGVCRYEGSWLHPRVRLIHLWDAVADERPVAQDFAVVGPIFKDTPSRHDRYLIQFVADRDARGAGRLGEGEGHATAAASGKAGRASDPRTFRVVAYLDRYSRVFAADGPVVAPPARRPELVFGRYPGHPDVSEADAAGTGAVLVYEGGAERRMAEFSYDRSGYLSMESWYDESVFHLGSPGEEVRARAYLAFVHRADRLAGRPVPQHGLTDVFELIAKQPGLAALRGIVELADRPEADGRLHAPALLEALAKWLEEAGLVDILKRDLPDDALTIERSARYGSRFRVHAPRSDASLSRRELWGLEAALNRFLLQCDERGGARPAAAATSEEVAALDRRLVAALDPKPLRVGPPDAASRGEEDGEWLVRCDVCAAFERLRLPVRAELSFNCDLRAGVAVVELLAPDGDLMPKSSWTPGGSGESGGAWTDFDRFERDRQALDYAAHLGAYAAAVAFRASPRIRRVCVTAWRFCGDTGRLDDLPEAAPKAFYTCELRRSSWREGELERLLSGSFTCLFEQGAGEVNPLHPDPARPLRNLRSAAQRRLLPESSDEGLDGAASLALGARRASELRIEREDYLRRIGEGLADAVVKTSTAADAIRVVRAEQERARARRDLQCVEACTRLMEGLAEGSIDASDQNDMVGKFLGADRCLPALARAKERSRRDPEGAAQLLMDAVAEAGALDGFIDGATTAWRYFDSYPSRVLYNRARAAAGEEAGADGGDSEPWTLSALAAADAPREVRLVSDSFFICHLEAAHLLEQSFTRIDDALRMARRAVELAPATTAAYRQLGRVYMLVGDAESAARCLKGGLRVAASPSEVALSYYQLAYVLWKAGRERAAGACYLKSLAQDGPALIELHAAAELRELVVETRRPLPAPDEVDGLLAEAGIPLAPAPDLLDALSEGAAAAVDSNIFPVARSLLHARLVFEPDEALDGVLRSLEDIDAQPGSVRYNL